MTKTIELTGSDLDNWTAKALGYIRLNCEREVVPAWGTPDGKWISNPIFQPSKQPERLIGLLSNEYIVNLERHSAKCWSCKFWYRPGNVVTTNIYGDDPVQVVCRALVFVEFGEEVSDDE